MFTNSKKVIHEKTKSVNRGLRKDDHVEYALRLNSQRGSNGLEDLFLVHNCLPEVNLTDINLSTSIAGLNLSSPIIINAMTGGSEEGKRINEALARVAKHCGLAVAVGSQTAALEDTILENSFRVVREIYPEGHILANIGMHTSPDKAEQAVAMIKADALQVHMNAAQEAIMVEGEKNFKGCLANIQKIVEHVSVPVIVKEVGFGIAKEQAMKLTQTGIKAIDVGGRGGTDFARIEAMRCSDKLGENFSSWGISTAVSVVEVSNAVGNSVDIVVTGGLLSGTDCVKAITLGANAVGIAGHFLNILMRKGEDQLIKEVEKIHKEMTIAMTLVGAMDMREAQKKPVIITGQSAEWLKRRGIDVDTYAQRPV